MKHPTAVGHEGIKSVEAFAQGQYARLRRLERTLASSDADEAVKTRGRELVARTEIDPTSRKLLYLSLGFFLFLVFWAYAQSGHLPS